MPIKPFELVDFGGVDSRSNPLNMPKNRCLRALNWCPKQDGHLELRWGYAAEPMSNVTPVPIHSLIPYQNWQGNKNYLIVGQGVNLSIHDLVAHTDTPAVIQGDPIVSTEKWNSYSANNRIHIGNGTDQKFFDGTSFRNNGLRAPTGAEVSGVVVTEGIRELTVGENSSITLTKSAGGINSFGITTGSGRAFYVAFFDVTTNELGPSTLIAGPGRLTFAVANQKVTVGAMPVASNPNWIKLVGFTDDGGSLAYLAVDGSGFAVSVGSCVHIGGTTLRVTSDPHGMVTGNICYLQGTGYDGIYRVTVIDANTFTINLPNSAGPDTTGGSVFFLVSVSAAATSVIVPNQASVSPTSFPAVINELPAILMNRDAGLPPVAAGLANSGYQFYAAIYNPITQHVGNRIAIGARHVNTTRVNIVISGLPDYSAIDPEWNILIGRTGDGAQIPYNITDQADNFIFAGPGQTTIALSQLRIDGNFEMPTRNGVIHPECTMFARVGTKSYAADPGSPTVRFSGDEADDNNGIFLGRPEQSWADNDIETFPTSAAVRGIHECDYELFVGTLHDCAILSDQNGQRVWKGPWNVGLAGPRAMCKADPYGFFWVSDKKEMCTLANGLPTPISEEHEAATLAQFGDAYIRDIELSYFRDPLKGKDELRVEGKKADGTPLTVICDFKLRDDRSPFGQGYTAQFQGPLSSPFTSVIGRDATNNATVYAGDNSGFLYTLYTGADDAGSQYDADAIMLVNAGPDRPGLPFIDFYGDPLLTISIGRTLQTDLSSFENLSPDSSGPQSVQGEEGDTWRAYNRTPQLINHQYFRFQLTSHSADGNLQLNSPPHLPLETYGRVWEIVPVMGESRGK